ncbi:hypothetical protein F444_07241 [Phytophthora nicotianae P1976]|uniref:Uncharacterized protein n=1 Tax=Phytophthora nicotianae P1976 TaxID=1317066 RepID=A0A081AFB2_PHYNI|nr:hypothetical protein F444_07241 [Phytophthora nicotianae P1976]
MLASCEAALRSSLSGATLNVDKSTNIQPFAAGARRVLRNSNAQAYNDDGEEERGDNAKFRQGLENLMSHFSSWKDKGPTEVAALIENLARAEGKSEVHLRKLYQWFKDNGGNFPAYMESLKHHSESVKKSN